jgi:hypothetical protein
MGSRVIGAVTLHALRTPTRTPASATQCRYSADQGQQLRHIMGIGRREYRCERDAPGIRNEVVLAACFAPVSRVGACFFPPCMARTEELSTRVRDHSICPAACKWVSSAWCSCVHTPARCHATRRRQQLTPDPQPISRGKAAQGMPVRSTNKIPVRACRWVMGLRPGWMRRLRFTLGSSGSTTSHSLSSTIGFDMNIPLKKESVHVKKYRSTHKSTTPA